jgi:Tol biopolymer transport system component
MSPEQATLGKVDARSDVFSFGALLYEMVTGRRAFAGTSTSETLSAVIKNQPTSPRELVPEIPEPLERIILRCLRKEPARRFQHMADVKVELEEVKDDSDSYAVASAGTVPGKRMRRRSWLMWAAPTLLILTIAGAGMLWRTRSPARPAPSVVQLSTERWANGGSFSPDGTQIAYASAGDAGTNWDIWLKIVGQAEARRLTTDPASENQPAWSPDGSQVAFVRYHSGTTRGLTWNATGNIYTVSPLGGEARRLADFPTRFQLSWSADGRWLAAAKARLANDPPGGIHLISTATGESHALTFPKPPSFDISPAFSPDGRSLAYVSCDEGSPACDVYVLSLDDALHAQRSARRLTQQRNYSPGLAWARDGRSIIFNSNGLWRVLADGSAPAERVELGAGGWAPSSARNRDRLTYVRGGDADIYRLKIGASPAPLVQSTFMDLQAQYSPDGQRLALVSARAGGGEIWLADADGSNLTRLTRGPGQAQGYPGWSPDGRWIVFDSLANDGHVDIWVIGVSGSGLRQITRHTNDDVMPSWSRDGCFIYFVSNRTGRFEVWRTRVNGGGPEEQMSRDGGAFPVESFNGRTIYYKRGSGDDALLGRPTAGGEERTVTSDLMMIENFR